MSPYSGLTTEYGIYVRCAQNWMKSWVSGRELGFTDLRICALLQCLLKTSSIINYLYEDIDNSGLNIKYKMAAAPMA
jgi:hypothetical protein